jgi:hypothetical protein
MPKTPRRSIPAPLTQLALFDAPEPSPAKNPDPPPDGSLTPPEGVTTAREPAPGEALGRVSPAPVRQESGHTSLIAAAPSKLRDKLMERRRREQRMRSR